MDTLGSLCDKLTVLKIKQWHTQFGASFDDLYEQEKLLVAEINDFIKDAFSGVVPLQHLISRAHKVHQLTTEGEAPDDTIGSIVAQLALVNLELWHQVETSYCIDDFSGDEAKKIVKNLASLNLDRNRYKEAIDDLFYHLCSAADAGSVGPTLTA